MSKFVCGFNFEMLYFNAQKNYYEHAPQSFFQVTLTFCYCFISI